MNLDKLLVAVDFDAHGAELVHAAAKLAVRMRAELGIVHVLRLPISVDADVLRNPQAHPAAAARMREDEEKWAPKLRALARLVRDEVPRVHLRLAHGVPSDAILEVARAEGAGLIVMGTHARKGLARLALGSVAEAVIRRSELPVTLVRVGRPAAPDGVRFRAISLDEER